MAAIKRCESTLYGGIAMKTRTANSLLKLRDQINAAYPHRNKASDGTIGDESHAAQGNASDHNPWLIDRGVGVVTAMDITHDPANGVDIDKLSDILIASRDPRIKYVIANGLIAGPGSNWEWQESSGHYSHIHISVNTNNYDDESKWKIGDAMTEQEAKAIAEGYKIPMRVLNSEAKGWDFNKVHKGEYDKREIEYMTHLVFKHGAVGAMTAYAQQAHDEGAAHRKNKATWQKAVKTLADVQKQLPFEEVKDKLYRRK